VINDRGIKQIYTLVMWKVHVPPRIHVFLSLLANNKTLTRDNLAKRRNVDDKSCLFCSENETVMHLFYECCVARNLWEIVAEITGLPLVTDFESMAKWWIRSKKYNQVNVFYAAVLWAVWKLRNKLCFQGHCWEGMRKVVASCAKLLRNWSLVNKSEDAAQLGAWARELEASSARPERVTWMPPDADEGTLFEQGVSLSSVVTESRSRMNENLSNCVPGSSLSEFDANVCSCNVACSDSELCFE
jgi:hypothetical protein